VPFDPQFLTKDDAIEIDRQLARADLADFIRMSWKHVEPAMKYEHGWHIDAVADHLTAVTKGQINRLLINEPPGVMKSMEVGVFWPMWEWGPLGMPHLRYIGASHHQPLAIRDNLRCRRLVTTDWFQERWPIKFTRDQDAKIRFDNTATGFREAVAVSSMTGSRGDRVIYDDPHSVERSVSDAKRSTDIRIFEETVTTRLNSPEHSAIVVIMQRLHEGDVAGHILEKELGYEHLMLPMEFEPERRCFSSVKPTYMKSNKCKVHWHHREKVWRPEPPKDEDGNIEEARQEKRYNVDIRKKEDELLFEGRFPRAVVDRDKKAMGSVATAGQYQQRPAPRGGASILYEMLQVGKPPEKFKKKVRYWDKAGTQGGGAYTAGALVGIDHDSRVWVLDIKRDQLSAGRREKLIKSTAKTDGREIPIWVEQEPGSGGKESAEATIRNLIGYSAYADRVTGDKVTRAEPFGAQVEAGNVWLARAGWNSEFVDECRTFPVGKFKDQVDAASGALAKVSAKKPTAGTW